MKRLLLVSMFQNVGKLLKRVEPNLRKKKMLFIPTASKVEQLGFFVNIGKWALKGMGLVVEELDISTAPYETMKGKLAETDYIYVAGGNTFFLLQELRRTGADSLLVEAVLGGKLYIGESAGAIVVAPDIGYSAPMDAPEKGGGLTDYKGLGLIDFYVVPHLENREMGAAAKEIVGLYAESLELKAITDNQAILVEDARVWVLGR